MANCPLPTYDQNLVLACDGNRTFDDDYNISIAAVQRPLELRTSCTHPTERYDQTLLAMDDGRITLFGGFTASGRELLQRPVWR
ncbi:hypothetical protein FNF29_08262 [Cafeteria roenbergensis]|uniref:Uncharacterized protein n=1 Tax=Cafeteria roenbergensis TaxID=33653 RepID=A0A5A8BZV5_CAFRO|nr:hypothetical protein FNF29_08262 [Cafeteria roenbergensis]|eukprot:KAA0146094.1 hypothetical protein FNF29_08262 [Cafeteria roenbergensis]